MRNLKIVRWGLLDGVELTAGGWPHTLLLMIAAACIAAPSGVFGAAPAEWQKRSEKSHFEAQLQPRGGSVVLGEFQDWVLGLRTAEGRPVQQANIAVGGGMQDHGHGLPTQPMVTAYLGDGKYLIEGVKLNMAGRWTLAFAVLAAGLAPPFFLRFLAPPSFRNSTVISFCRRRNSAALASESSRFGGAVAFTVTLLGPSNVCSPAACMPFPPEPP